MWSRAAANAACASRSVVSSTQASGATRKGATARSASRRSRSCNSAKTAAYIGASPLRPQLLEPPPRPLVVARGDEQLEARVGADDGADVAPGEHGAAASPPNWRWNGRSAARTSGPRRRSRHPARHPRRAGGRARRRRRASARAVATAAAASSGKSGPGPTWPRADGAVEQARVEKGQARNARRAAAPACSCRMPPGRRPR